MSKMKSDPEIDLIDAVDESYDWDAAGRPPIKEFRAKLRERKLREPEQSTKAQLAREVTLGLAQENLQQFIRASVSELIRTSEAPDLFTVERSEQMSKALSHFVVQSTEKYIKGQIEHGSNAVDGLETRDLQGEMAQEIQDMFWYNTAALWKK